MTADGEVRRPFPALLARTADVADGEAIEVAGLPGEATVADLAATVGLDVSSARDLLIDGRSVGGAVPLSGAGVVRGSLMSTGQPPATLAEGAHVLRCIAGPAAGGRWSLRAGRYVLGRAISAPIRVRDHMLEPHHLALDVSVGGHVRLFELAGTAALVSGATDGEPPVLGVGAQIEVGASRFVVERANDELAGHPAVAPSDPWRLVHQRSPRLQHGGEHAVRVHAPSTPAAEHHGGPAGLVPALAGLGGTVLLALLFRQPTLLLFGMVGGLVGIAGWATGQHSAHRRRRRRRQEQHAALQRFADALAAAHRQVSERHRRRMPDVATVLRRAHLRSPSLWAQRGGDGDAYTVGVGIGDMPAPIDVIGDGGSLDQDGVTTTAHAYALMRDVVVPVSLGSGACIGVVGDRAAALALCRSLIVQLSAACGPADWSLIVAVDDAEPWGWTGWLPQLAAGGLMWADGDDDAIAPYLDAPGTQQSHIVIVTDRPHALARRSAAIRRLADARRACVVTVADTVSALPAATTMVVQLGARWRARVFNTGSSGPLPDIVHAAGLSVADATAAAAALSPLIDPERGDDTTEIPDEVGLFELAMPGAHGERSVSDVLRRWRSSVGAGRAVATLGVAHDGVVELDLDRDGPHALVGGTTGSGKSELLRTFVASLALSCAPDDVTFVLVDYKGGATFDACVDLPHVVGVVTDLDEHLAQRALRSLDAELRQREHRLREVGHADLGAARRDAAAKAGPVPPRLVIVVDEFAHLATEQAEFLRSLVGVAQRGRSLGVHLVLATQRPSGVISDDIRANTNARVALRLNDAADSTDVVGTAAASALPRRKPGRALLRLGSDEPVAFQAARVSRPMAHQAVEVTARRVRLTAGAVSGSLSEADDPSRGHATELVEVVDLARRAARLAGCTRPTTPWCPPLPAVLDGAEVDDGAVGLCDLPDEQRQVPLRWELQHGNLLVCGDVGMGTTSTLTSIAVALASAHAPAALHIYAVDARGDEAMHHLQRLPHCGGVVRLDEHERVRRLLARLGAELRARKRDGTTGPDSPDVVVLVDGLDAVRAAFDGDRAAGSDDDWDQIVSDSGAHGIQVIASVTTPSALPTTLLGRFADRWVFHLSDRYEAASLGLASRDVPPRIPGRCAVVASGAHAQIRVPHRDHAGVRHGPGGPPPVEVLPERIAMPRRPLGEALDAAATLELPLGVSFVDGRSVALLVPPGAHLTVVGPARSGRSTALARVSAAWRAAFGPSSVVAIGGPSSVGAAEQHLLAALAEHRRALVVVDDADIVIDPDGVLAQLTAPSSGRISVAISGRADSLRSQPSHWTAAVRRSRRGLVLTGGSDLDGDVLGTVLPRRLPSPAPPGLARPGLGWLVGDGDPVLVQVAVEHVDPDADRRALDGMHRVHMKPTPSSRKPAPVA